jgi:hypothetical protein
VSRNSLVNCILDVWYTQEIGFEVEIEEF